MATRLIIRDLHDSLANSSSFVSLCFTELLLECTSVLLNHSFVNTDKLMPCSTATFYYLPMLLNLKC